MSIIYKITYEHRAGEHMRMEEVLVESEDELTKSSESVLEAARRDSTRFHKGDVASISIVSVVPVP